MMRTETVDAISNVANRVGYTGAGFTFFSYLTSNEFLGVFSALITIAGFTTNWYYKRKADLREEKAAERAARTAELENEERELNLQLLRQRIKHANEKHPHTYQTEDE